MLYPYELKNRSNLFCDYRISGEGRTRTSKSIILHIICDETVNLDYPFGRRANTAYFTNLHTSPNISLFSKISYSRTTSVRFIKLNNQLYFNYTIFYSIQKITQRKF